MKSGNPKGITFRALILGALFAAIFAALTVVLENRRDMLPTANQIPLYPYILLVLTVLIVNPACRLLRVVRPFSSAEILIVFVMGAISSGVSTFGLTGQVVPVIGSLFNQHWNNDQTEWNRYVEPYVNESFFLAEPGIQDAALAYVAARQELDEARAEHQAAVRRRLTGAVDPDTAAGTARLDAEIDRLQALVRQRRQALKTLESKAAERVEVFRRGLPRSMRAYPGVFFTTDDDAGTYFRRIARLLHGKRAARKLQGALTSLGTCQAESIPPPAERDAVRTAIKGAAEDLAPSADAAALEHQRTVLTETDGRLGDTIVRLDEELISLNREKRLASVEESKRLAKRIADLNDEKDDVAKERQITARELERNRNSIEATGRVAAVRRDLLALADATDTKSAGEVSTALRQCLAQFPSFDASFKRYFFGDVPWRSWARPLLHWALLIGLTYMVLMTFNVLIFRQWATNEKLIFPLAELSELLAGAHDPDQGGNGHVPAVFKSGLFWTGFAISGGVMGWNLLSRTGWLPGLPELDLVHSWTPYIRNSPFKGLCYGARSSIFFTMIGVAFLIPKKVSFSLWFFHLLYMAQLLLLVAFGFGQNEGSFPSEWWYTLNFRTAEGGGAMLVFASVVLWKCRTFLLCSLRPAAVGDLEQGERRELLLCSGLFLSGSLGLILVLWRGLGVHWFYAMFGYAVIMVITIGLIRAVAEGGILGFQAWIGPFHFVRHVVGFGKSFTAPSLFAPLMVYYSIMFLDIKTFIAPAMANGLKIREDLGMSRKRYHGAVILGIAVACVVAIGTAVMMCYAGGADAMHSWFYTSFPRSLFSRIADVSKVPPSATAQGRFWLLAGGLMMAALLYFRQSFFWLPHPIGMIMLVNPLMRTYWFSILLGWIGKALVTKYGNKETYTRVRCAFVGLIVGELVVVALAMILSLILQKKLGIDLNRN